MIITVPLVIRGLPKSNDVECTAEVGCVHCICISVAFIVPFQYYTVAVAKCVIAGWRSFQGQSFLQIENFGYLQKSLCGNLNLWCSVLNHHQTQLRIRKPHLMSSKRCGNNFRKVVEAPKHFFSLVFK